MTIYEHVVLFRSSFCKNVAVLSVILNAFVLSVILNVLFYSYLHSELIADVYENVAMPLSFVICTV